MAPRLSFKSKEERQKKERLQKKETKPSKQNDKGTEEKDKKSTERMNREEIQRKERHQKRETKSSKQNDKGAGEKVKKSTERIDREEKQEKQRHKKKETKPSKQNDKGVKEKDKKSMERMNREEKQRKERHQNKETKPSKQNDKEAEEKDKKFTERIYRSETRIKRSQEENRKTMTKLQDCTLKLLTFDNKPREKPPRIENKFDPNKEVSPVLEKTNYFRDEIRRIDLILVMADDDDPGVEKMKLNYMISIVKAGLEVEIERGTMKRHKNLVFVKVHAPDAILEEHGQLYMSRRYFKDSHMAFINTSPTLLERCFRICSRPHERKWIQIVRQHWKGPFFFSNLERSMIVYKILLLLPFGAHRNYYGLTRLTNKDIVLGVYALHDGPYFVAPEQRLSTMNARQILFYNWVGCANMYKSQPLNLVNEYFGGKIALYFAFYALYNLWLTVPALAGLIAFIYQGVDYKNKKDLVDQYCDSEDLMCPACHFVSVCPFIPLKDYCMRAKIVNFLSSNSLLIYACIMSVWVFILVMFWSRTESYWVWMWQLGYGNNRFFTSITRPEYKYYNKAQVRSKVTAVLKNYDAGVVKFMRMLLLSLLFVVFVAVALFFSVLLIHLKHGFMMVTAHNELIATTIVGFITFILVFSLKCVYRKVAYCLTDLANHRTYVTYMRAVSYKYFCINIVFVCSMIAYYAWLKGTFYTYPGDVGLWNDPLKLLLSNCGPLPCLDEAFITYIIAFMFHVVFLRIWKMCTRIRTDYNQGKEVVENFPSWEREYCLDSITENTMMDKFNTLAVQFTLLTAFAPIFTLGPLIALLVNFWEIKRDARHFLLSCRRPVLLTSPGLDAWKNIFYVIAFFTASCCGLTLIRTTLIVPAYVYKLCAGSYNDFVDFHTVTFTKDLFYDAVGRNTVDTDYPEQCNMIGAFYITQEYMDLDELWRGWSLNTRPSKIPATNSLIPKPEYYMEKFYELMLLMIMENASIVVMLLMFYYISPMTRSVTETIAVENRIRDLYMHTVRLQETRHLNSV